MPVHSSNFRAFQQHFIPNTISQVLVSWRNFPLDTSWSKFAWGKQKSNQSWSPKSAKQRPVAMGGESAADCPTGPGARGPPREGAGRCSARPRNRKQAASIARALSSPAASPRAGAEAQAAGVGCGVARLVPRLASRRPYFQRAPSQPGDLSVPQPALGRSAARSPPLARPPALAARLGPGRWTAAGAPSFRPRPLSRALPRALARLCSPARARNLRPRVTCLGKSQFASSPDCKRVDSAEPKTTFLGEGGGPHLEGRGSHYRPRGGDSGRESQQG